MLEFLKKLFSKEAEKVSVKLEDLDRWFDERTKHYDSELNNYTKQKILEIDSIKKEIETANEELMGAVPEEEEKIMPKVRNVVEGARKNYIRQITQLMKDILIQGKDTDTLISSCSAAQEKLNQFAKDSAKSYYTTQHLFHRQVRILAQHINRLDKIVRELNGSIKNSKTVKALEMKALISKLKKNISLLGEWKELIGKLEEQKDILMNQEKRVQQDIKESRQSEEYKEYEQNIKDIGAFRHGLKKKSDDVFELMAPLETALKKYERIALENQGIIKKYMENPVKALIEDKEKKLLDILGKLKNSIEKGSLDLKDKKKEKTIKIMNSITKEEIEAMQKNYTDIEKKIAEIKDSLGKNKAKSKEEGLLNEKQKTSDELQNTEREVRETKERIEKINIEKEKKEITSKIKELLNIEATLE